MKKCAEQMKMCPVLQITFFQTGHGVSREGSSQENVMKQNNVYDDAYFSSGSEDEDNVGGVLSKSKERRKIQTNDELLYDPNMDEENEIWVKEQREGHQNKGRKIP